MMSRLDMLERVAMLALHIRKLELDLVTEQNALEVRERLQKMRVQLDRSLVELQRSGSPEETQMELEASRPLRFKA